MHTCRSTNHTSPRMFPSAIKLIHFWLARALNHRCCGFRKSYRKRSCNRNDCCCCCYCCCCYELDLARAASKIASAASKTASAAAEGRGPPRVAAAAPLAQRGSLHAKASWTTLSALKIMQANSTRCCFCCS